MASNVSMENDGVKVNCSSSHYSAHGAFSGNTSGGLPAVVSTPYSADDRLTRRILPKRRLQAFPSVAAQKLTADRTQGVDRPSGAEIFYVMEFVSRYFNTARQKSQKLGPDLPVVLTIGCGPRDSIVRFHWPIRAQGGRDHQVPATGPCLRRIHTSAVFFPKIPAIRSSFPVWCLFFQNFY